MRTILKKIAVILFALLLVALLCLACFAYVNNRSALLRAQQMMNDAAQLEIGADMSRVLAFGTRYHAGVGGKSGGDPCIPSDCLVVATVPKDEFIEKHPKLYYGVYREFVRREWSYSVFMWIKNGKLAAQQEWYTYLTPELTNMVIVESSSGSPRLCRHPSYQLHKTFSVDMAPKHFNIWVNTSEKKSFRVSRLNLGCVHTLRGCRTLADMAPDSWRIYESDRKILEKSSPWTPEQVETCIQSFPRK